MVACPGTATIQTKQNLVIINIYNALLLHKKTRVTSPPLYLQRNLGHVIPACFHCYERNLKNIQLKYLHKDNMKTI